MLKLKTLTTFFSGGGGGAQLAAVRAAAGAREGRRHGRVMDGLDPMVIDDCMNFK